MSIDSLSGSTIEFVSPENATGHGYLLYINGNPTKFKGRWYLSVGKTQGGSWGFFDENRSMGSFNNYRKSYEYQDAPNSIHDTLEEAKAAAIAYVVAKRMEGATV